MFLNWRKYEEFVLIVCVLSIWSLQKSYYPLSPKRNQYFVKIVSFFRIWVCIELKIQILVWIYYGCLESTKELLRLPLTTTGRAERRKKGNPNSWGTLVRGLKTNLPSSSTVENLHSYSLKPVMILSNSRNVLTSRLLHKICINLVFDIGLLFLRAVFFFMAQTWWIIDAHTIAIKQLFSCVIFGFIEEVMHQSHSK